MCGISGIFAYRAAGQDPSREELRKISDHMQARGPDASGEWVSVNKRVALAHKRLQIIDLSDRAAQPMQTADGRLVVTFNGEIYNFASLRTRLQAQGYVFQSTSDTEVLLHLYASSGIDMLQELRGMFAFALWDEARQALLLARDPYGIKPLYYADDGKTVRFASQVRALLAGGNVSAEQDPAAQVGFYLWGSVPEPLTLYRAVRVVPAGTSITFAERGRSHPRIHFSVAKCWADACEIDNLSSGSESQQEEVCAGLLDSVRHHLVADVPISAFLSAGVDSGALLGLMAECGAQLRRAITLSFSEFKARQADETLLAATVARHYGIEHSVRRVDHAEFQRDIPAILNAMDQPSNDGINTWFVSKATAELGFKVAVSGLGGDELFGGYPSFRDLPRLVATAGAVKAIPGIKQLFSLGASTILNKVDYFSPKTAGLLEFGDTYAGAYFLRRGIFMPWELQHFLPQDVVQEGLERLWPITHAESLLSHRPRIPFASIATLEACQYMRNQLLRDTDWASMAHSLEIRVPFVDTQLLQGLAPLLVHTSRNQGKLLLGHSSRRRLPEAILHRRKTGFSTPIADWIETTPDLDAWRRVPMLARKQCHWSRRFAYVVAQYPHS